MNKKTYSSIEWLDIIDDPERGLMGTFVSQGYTAKIGSEQMSLIGGQGDYVYATLFADSLQYAITDSNAVFSASYMDELDTQLYSANNRTYNVLYATGAYSLGSQTVLSNGSIIHISTIDDDFDGDYLSNPFDADDDGDSISDANDNCPRAVV